MCPASSAVSASVASLATLLHDSHARPFSIDIDPCSEVAQGPDFGAEPSLNSALSLSVDMPSAVFDFRRLHNYSTYLATKMGFIALLSPNRRVALSRGDGTFGSAFSSRVAQSGVIALSASSAL
jgi:hypothetical protein